MASLAAGSAALYVRRWQQDSDTPVETYGAWRVLSARRLAGVRQQYRRATDIARGGGGVSDEALHVVLIAGAFMVFLIVLVARSLE